VIPSLDVFEKRHAAQRSSSLQPSIGKDGLKDATYFDYFVTAGWTDVGCTGAAEPLHGPLPFVLFSEVGVDVEERVDAFEQSRFDFVRRAVNDV
jgi:hypothetical protein